MRIRRQLIGVCSVLICGGLAAQEKPVDAAAAFGARMSVLDLSLSPDGRRVAFIAPTTGQGTAVYVLSLEKGAVPQLAATLNGDPMRFESCAWVAKDRLACQAFGIQAMVSTGTKGLVPVSRMVAFDADGRNVRSLSNAVSSRTYGYHLNGGDIIDWLPDEDGAILMTREYLPENSIGTRLASDREGLGVDRIDTRTGASRTIELPSSNAESYLTDGQGTVRVMANVSRSMSDMERGITHYLYRLAGSRSWQGLSTSDKDGNGFRPLAVDKELNAVYGLQKLDGRMALYRIKLDDSLQSELVYANPEVDVDGVFQVGPRQRVAGVAYTTESAHIHYFDPKLESLMTALHKAVPQPQLALVGTSTDENVLLMWAGGDSEPGVSYIFNRTTHEMRIFVVRRSSLEGVTLSKVKALTYPARDGTAIPAFLTLPPGKDSPKGLPALVMPHGGPFARDSWGFDYLAQFFAHEGFAVLQPNYRGSAGYGDAWEVKGGFQSWQTAIGDVSDAGHWLTTQGVDPGKLAIVGWSYGGLCSRAVSSDGAGPLQGRGRDRTGDRSGRTQGGVPGVEQFSAGGAVCRQWLDDA